MELDMVHNHAEELERRLRLQSYPVALKLLKDEDSVPDGAERPLRDLGYRVALCQGYALSRKEGKTIAMFKDDMVCFEPIVGYGWAKPPQHFLDGHNRYPLDVETLEAGRNYVADFPSLAVGKYCGVVSAPLGNANFEPDIILIYCNSAQLSLLLLGREYEDGHDLACHLSSHAACVYAVVPPLQSGNCQVAVPCRGDRYMAMAGDDEIIFSIPVAKLEKLLAGLRHLERSGCRLPRSPQMRRDPDFPQSYIEILRMMG